MIHRGHLHIWWTAVFDYIWSVRLW